MIESASNDMREKSEDMREKSEDVLEKSEECLALHDQESYSTPEYLSILPILIQTNGDSP